MDLLNLCLTSTYYQYNGKHYKQLYGTAMGSPVSVIVAEIVMQRVEGPCNFPINNTTLVTLRWRHLYRRSQDENDAFHDHLNEQNADIQFTKEIKDCLVSRDNNELWKTVYRKSTHTHRLLDESSYNPTSHKATTSFDTPDSLRDQNKYLEHVFLKNNYNADFNIAPFNNKRL